MPVIALRVRGERVHPRPTDESDVCLPTFGNERVYTRLARAREMLTMAKRTPLYKRHLHMGARLIEFAGWELPLQFAGVNREHAAVREHAGLFDIGHMGVVTVRGARAEEYLQRLLTNDLHRLSHTGKILYSCMCRHDGGILDDLLVYENFEEGLLLVVNAATTQSDLDWMWQQADEMGYDAAEVSIAHRADMSMFALQGPAAVDLLQPLVTCPLEQLPYYNGMPVRMRDKGLACGRGPAILSRTGYTGEDGFEIIAPADMVSALWDRLIETGAVPCGLAVRDILRLEMGYCLYGQDIHVGTTPLEAGLDWIVSFKKQEDFIGRAALERQRRDGVAKRLVGLVVGDKGIPRRDCPIYACGRLVGAVTSGTYSPRLDHGIALGYVETVVAEQRPPVGIIVRSRELAARLVDLPFYHPAKPARAAAKA